MLLLTSFLVDILIPEEDENISFYNNFLSQYTSITVTAIVSQLTFSHETYTDMTKEALDNDINNMIESIPDAANQRRTAYPFYCRGAMIDPGSTIQEEENRSFISNLFIQDATKYNLSNREMVLKGLNTSAFLNYFFLFEDNIKNIYIQEVSSSNTNSLGGSKVISTALKGIIENKEIKNEFFLELNRRSKFFINYQSLNRTWKFLNFIRNRLIHYNGFYDEKAKKLFKSYYEDILKTYKNNDSMLLSIVSFSDKIEKYQIQIDTNNYLIVDDVLENIIRNTSISIMESLFICEKNKS